MSGEGADRLRSPLPYRHAEIAVRRPSRRSRRTCNAWRNTPVLSSNEERIFPFLSAPWQRQASDFGGRLRITPGSLGTKKDEAAKEHIEKIEEFKYKPDHLLIYSDGSLRNLHGFRRVGAGVVIYHEEAEVYARSMGLGAKAEVYDGELTGLLMGARGASKFLEDHPDVKHVHIFADKTAAINAIFNPLPRAGQLISHNFHKTISKLLDDDPARTVEIVWAPGHKKIRGNERADELAKAGVELGATVSGTRCNALRRAKEKMKNAWVKAWKAAPNTGRYAIANQFPPSLKHTKHFDTQREVFGRLVQCRTGHAFIGEYYKQFVPDENVDCPCGEALQTREHILCDCPRYQPHRHILSTASRDLSLSEILGTKKGIEA